MNSVHQPLSKLAHTRHHPSFATEDDKHGLVDKLRVVSRQEYLKKREDAQL